MEWSLCRPGLNCETMLSNPQPPNNNELTVMVAQHFKLFKKYYNLYSTIIQNIGYFDIFVTI